MISDKIINFQMENIAYQSIGYTAAYRAAVE